MSFSRGAVWFVEVPGVGDKPALIVSWQPIQQALHSAIVARITSAGKKRSLPTAIPLESGEAGLERPSFVLCHDLFMIERERFRRFSGLVSARRMIDVEAGLRRALDLP